MKKIDLNTVRIAFGLFLVSFVLACSTDSVNEPSIDNSRASKEKFQLKSSQFDWIGNAHNLALENTFLVLQENSDVNLQSFLEDELANPIYGLDPKSPDFELLGESVDVGLNLTANGVTSLDKIPDLNQEVLNYLIQLENIILVGKDVKESINSLEKDIDADLKLTNKDLYILYSATSVGKYSYEYWLENAQKWAENVNAPMDYANFSTKSCSWWQMTGANSCLGQFMGAVVMGDIIGAISGAVAALVVNVWIGPGQLAYAVAILGSGVAGSVGSGLHWIFN